jgi:CBS domain containing-hemolysin-like protein
VDTETTVEATNIVWLLGLTLFFVLLNGFFVAAEFALVKVPTTRVKSLAEQGGARARLASHILTRLDLYLSACQLGITVASLILGWLAEPAVARLLIAGAHAVGWQVGDSALLHAISLALALTIVTTLHMTLGEQAPKIWAIQRAEVTALTVARPLHLFTLVFRPLIWVINKISNGLLRLVGISSIEHHEASLSADELRAVLTTSAQAGHITARQRRFAENILRFVSLEVRHILVPRVEVVELCTQRLAEDNLRAILESTHSRFPLCEDDLDEILGIVHAKDVLAALASGDSIDLRAMARKPVFVPDTQPLGKMIAELQQAKAKLAVVLDDRGTAIGLAFLEDALESIVGPIQDEFDDEEEAVRRPQPGVIEMRGDLSLPEAAELLGLDEAGEDDTIGGHVVSILGRLPKQGDELTMGVYRVAVTQVCDRRVHTLRCERTDAEGNDH